MTRMNKHVRGYELVCGQLFGFIFLGIILWPLFSKSSDAIFVSIISVLSFFFYIVCSIGLAWTILFNSKTIEKKKQWLHEVMSQLGLLPIVGIWLYYHPPVKLLAIDTQIRDAEWFELKNEASNSSSPEVVIDCIRKMFEENLVKTEFERITEFISDLKKKIEIEIVSVSADAENLKIAMEDFSEIHGIFMEMYKSECDPNLDRKMEAHGIFMNRQMAEANKITEVILSKNTLVNYLGNVLKELIVLKSEIYEGKTVHYKLPNYEYVSQNQFFERKGGYIKEI